MRYTWIFALLLWSIGSLAQVDDRFKKGGNSNKEETTAEEEPEEAKAKTTQKNSDLWDKLVFGGGFGASFGNVSDIVTLSPQVGYQVTDYFMAGGGYLFNYIRLKQGFDGFRFIKLLNPRTQAIHGPNIFGNFFLFEQFSAGMQFELLNHDALVYNGSSFSDENRWTSVLFIQGGLSQEVGRKGRVQFGLRYNLLQDRFSPYADGIIPYANFFF